MVPKPPPIGHLAETEHFFDAAIAIGAHDQNRARDLGGRLPYAEHNIVMELALRPMIDVLPPERLQPV
jgi:hypothetical protein